MENKTPFRAVLRPRRRLNGWCAVDCARWWAGGAMVTPVSYFYYLQGALGPLATIIHATTRKVALGYILCI